MAEVHKAITAHSQKQHEIVATFLRLEAQREAAIEAAVALCTSNKPFSTDGINAVTKQINELAGKYGIVPTRKYVTTDMVVEYVSRVNNG